MDEQMQEKLGFHIDSDMHGVRVLTYVSGGCRPASEEEIALWDALAALSQPAAADEVKAELLGALQQLADELNDVLSEGGASPFSSEATQRARAAIAKATP